MARRQLALSLSRGSFYLRIAGLKVFRVLLVVVVVVVLLLLVVRTKFKKYHLEALNRLDA